MQRCLFEFQVGHCKYTATISTHGRRGRGHPDGVVCRHSNDDDYGGEVEQEVVCCTRTHILPVDAAEHEEIVIFENNIDNHVGFVVKWNQKVFTQTW